MSYIRVIPRDLFNEGNLLKMLGALYIALEQAGDHSAEFEVEDVPAFDVEQSEDDGSIAVVNLPFSIAGVPYRLSRPLNSRAAWPLYATPLEEDGGAVEVFTGIGTLSEAFRELIGAGA